MSQRIYQCKHLICVSLGKQRVESLLLRVREQMPIPTTHFLGCMANPFVNHTLINSLGGTVATERMAKCVPTSKVAKLTLSDSGLEMVCGFAGSQRIPRLAGATTNERVADRIFAFRSNFVPLVHRNIESF